MKHIFVILQKQIKIQKRVVNQMQVQSDLAIDRLIKLSNLIESSCQFLTVVRRCITDEQILQRDNMPTLGEYLEQKKWKLNEESLIQVFIQVAYFVFSCRRFNIQPQIGKEDIRVQEITFKNIQEKKFSPMVFYKITEEKQLQPFQSIKIVREIFAFFFNHYAQYLQLYKTQLNPSDMKFKLYMDKFREQVEYLLADPNIYEPNKQKEFFLCLEETSLFRQFSSLLKIKNCSILDLIKSKESNLLKFKQYKQKDVDFVIAYSNEKKKPKTDHDKLKQKQKQAEYNITQLFKFLQKSENPSMIQETTLNTKIQKEQFDKMKITYKHSEKSLNLFYQSVRKILPTLPQVTQQQSQIKRQQSPEMQYLIEYSHDRNSICVRLMPNQIKIHIQNSDFLMYQSNILTFETVNVNIQLIESVVEANLQKKTAKKLAFKGTSCLNSKEPPLEKILLLMDATMIASKICEPQLNAMKVVYSGLSDHERINLVANKINHYTRIYLKCAKKVYSQ